MARSRSRCDPTIGDDTAIKHPHFCTGGSRAGRRQSCNLCAGEGGAATCTRPHFGAENLITSIRSFRRIDNVITYQLNFPLQVRNPRNHRQTEAHTTYVSIQSARLCKDGQPSQLVLVLGDSAAEPDNRQLLVNG